MENATCAGYLTLTLSDTSVYLVDEPPKPISCENQTLNGWGPPEHQGLSCCDETSRFFAQFGGEGFDTLPGIFPKNGVIDTEETDQKYSTECAPYIDNLKATICDPLQGSYIRPDPNNTDGTLFRVCKSSCDLVFQQCEYLLPLSNLTADITSGTEFCLSSWASWDNGFGICDAELDGFHGFRCDTNLQVQVVEDDCLTMVIPSKEDLASYEKIGYPIDLCEAVEEPLAGVALGVIIGVSVAVGFALIAAGFLFRWLSKRKRDEGIS